MLKVCKINNKKLFKNIEKFENTAIIIESKPGLLEIREW